MSTTPYQALTFSELPVGATYSRPRVDLPSHLSPDDPAIQAMTDLRRVTALTVERTMTLAATRERMRKLGVRMLLVTNASSAVIGVVTVTDLDSGRPERIAEKTGESADELSVKDIMTLRGRIEVLRIEDVERVRVGDILATLRDRHRRHALVVCENAETQATEVCGIFSLSQICRLVGLNVKPGDDMDLIEMELMKILG